MLLLFFTQKWFGLSCFRERVLVKDLFQEFSQEIGFEFCRQFWRFPANCFRQKVLTGVVSVKVVFEKEG